MNELSHHGADDEHGRLAGGGQTVTEEFAPVGSVERHHCGHVEGFAQKGMTDLGQARFAVHAGIRVMLSRITCEAHLHWRDWTRYSSRQQQEMSLGGVVGTWNLYNLPPALWPALWLGQWLYAGKNTTFGLGQYRLLEEEQ
jgi:CRISPR-associated endoribonuclease Cas6